MYDLAIIGGGPGGYVAAERAGGAGLSVILFEKRELGGVCLNEGCIPTKTLLYSAKVLDYAHHADKYGVTVDGAALEYAKVLKRKEKVVKKLGEDDTHFVEVNGGKIYIPSANLHALFLQKHMMNDFTAFSMTLRQLLDWAFLVEKNTKEIDWEWLVELLKKNHMLDFYNTINAICVEDLGFDANIFPNVQFDPFLKDQVLNDVLYPKYTADEPSRLVPRLIYKYKRWKGNGWKHKMCYNESMWSAFWSGVWSHLLKPSSI